MFETEVVDKIKTHFRFQNATPSTSPENRTIYEIMWKNTVEPDKS